MTASPIPVASYGRDAKVSEAVRQKLLPDYDGASTIRRQAFLLFYAAMGNSPLPPGRRLPGPPRAPMLIPRLQLYIPVWI